MFCCKSLAASRPVALSFLFLFALLLSLCLSPVNGAAAGAGRGDWWMFHHDPQHTGRSPFTGPGSPVLQWAFPTEAGVESSPAIAADGTIYLWPGEGYLYALNADGTLKWALTVGSNDDSGSSSSIAIGTDGTLYVGSDDDHLYAITPDGTLKWAFSTGGAIFSSPAIGADGTIYVGSYDDNLYAVNPDGTQQWACPTGSYIDSSPAIGADGTLYLGSEDHNLYAINADGTQQWTFPTRWGIYSSPAIGADGTIYVGSEDFNLYALNPDGTQQWAFPTRGDILSSPAIGEDGTIYVGSYDANLYAVNPDGTPQWAFPTGYVIASSPTIGADGTIYVGSDDHNLYAINPDGTQQWAFPTAGFIYSTPVIGANGTIYVGSDDCCMYAIGSAPLTALALSATPLSPQPVHTPLTLTATATGGSKMTYQFWLYNSAATPAWSQLQGYSSTAVCTWTPTAPGSYLISATARDGATGTEVTATCWYTAIIAGAGRGDWWMFRHDRQHTGRSSFSGPASPVLQWKFLTGAKILASPCLASDGTIYVGATDNHLYAIYPDGTQKWAFPNAEGSPAIGADGTIYVGSNGDNLYAVNPDGTQKWMYTAGGAVDSAPTIGSDGTIYVGVGDGKLYAINPDGTQQWVFSPEPLLGRLTEPALGADGTIYVGFVSGPLYAVNPDGTQKWVFANGTGILTIGGIDSPTIGADGTIYVGGDTAQFVNNAYYAAYYCYALNPDGTQKWAFPTNSAIDGCPALGADGTIYVASALYNLYALNPDGTQKWASSTGNSNGTSSLTIGADGTLYVGEESSLCAVDPDDGSLGWAFPLSGGTLPLIDSSPAIGANGVIYIGGFDGDLYAIGGPVPPLTTLALSASPASPQPVNTSVTLTAAANGGTNVQYVFWQYNPAATPAWSQLQGYSSAATCRWTPAVPGNYLLSATAQDVVTGTTVNNSLWYSAMGIPLTAVAMTVSPSGLLADCYALDLTATATGGTNVQFQFWSYNPNTTPAWSLLQGYSSRNICTWMPTLDGNYLLSVTACDGITGAEVNKTIPYYLACLPLNIKISPASPQPSNTPITLTATGQSGPNLQFQFWVYNPNATQPWSLLQAYSSRNTCTWTPAAPGNYLLSVTLRDSATGAEVNSTLRYTVQ